MTDIVLPPRAQRRNLSVEAYLNELEAARRWKREHPADARAHDYSRCACGNQMKRDVRRCRECYSGEREERVQKRRYYIAWHWAAGMTVREIADGLGSTVGSIAKEIHRMRKDGWDLPYRRVPRGSAN